MNFAAAERVRLQSALQDEANRALARGSLYLAWLGLLAGLLAAALQLAGAAQDLWLPAGFAFAAGACCLIIHALARAGRMRGVVSLIAFAVLSSLPTFFFLACHFWLPSGAATYLTGPISYLYLVVIAGSGFLFDPRVSLAAGLVAALGLMLSFALGREHLLSLQAADPTLRQDLISPAIWSVKSFMMAFAGLLVAGLSTLVQNLLVRLFVAREREARVSRLFGEYISPEVAARIVAEKADLSGEKRSVAVLFSDLRGFSSISERVPPEALVPRLNRYFDAMVECIGAEGGVVDKFIGDAVMAVFGGVLELASPCDAAVRAAVRMRRRLWELNREWLAAGQEPFENGIGLAFGEVLQGNIGSARRKEFTVIGDTVNTASRVEGLSKDFSQRILLTGEVHDRLGGELRSLCQPLGRVKVRGKAEEIVIFGIGDDARATPPTDPDE